MELVRYYYKNLGETPLECLRRFQAENGEYQGIPATYAGRLDPAASGEMIFLFGEMVHKKEEYLSHNKTYKAVFAIGVSTDTSDLLGIVLNTSNIVSIPDEEKIKKITEKILNLKIQTYPAYSSKPVDGKPLFVHTREGNNVERPKRNIEIFKCELEGIEIIKKEKLIKNAEKICQIVKGDFRQSEIIEKWKESSNKISDEIPTITFSLNVSTGTYIRSLTEIIEEVLGVPAVLFSLERVNIQSNVQ